MSEADIHGLRHWSISTVNKAEKDRGLLVLHIKGLKGILKVLKKQKLGQMREKEKEKEKKH